MKQIFVIEHDLKEGLSARAVKAAIEPYTLGEVKVKELKATDRIPEVGVRAFLKS